MSTKYLALLCQHQDRSRPKGTLFVDCQHRVTFPRTADGSDISISFLISLQASSGFLHASSLSVSATMTRIATTAFFIASSLLVVRQNNAFCPPVSSTLSLTSSIRPQKRQSTMLLSGNHSPFADATEPVQQVDANGKVFSQGTVVAVAPNTKVKAYHVPKDAFGSFDLQGRFFPADGSKLSHGTSCLVLSEGLRGEVVRVYNVNEWDRTHPILVKFKQGRDREGGEGGFVVPKPFTMHFDADEIIVVD